MSAVQPPRIAAPVAHPQRLDLTPEQFRLIHTAAAELLRAAVTDQPAVSVSLPGEVAGRPVSGAFVSLKRGKHLRACCGGLLDRPVPLHHAVADAVTRTALDDARFPPVSPGELPYLDLEVWLLFNPQRVQARGLERAEAVVTGGKHGLIVRRGDSRGLLLPGVAAEHGWDARTFLEQVCVKAGLHPSLWKDDDTTLLTFEGASFREPAAAASEGLEVGAFLSRQELTAYAEFCGRNLAAMLVGALPNYSLGGAPDGHVSGLVLTVGAEGSADRLQVSNLSLRPPFALQATLFRLTQAAAQTLTAQGITEADLAGLSVGLTVLYDPAMHGSAREPDLRGVDVSRRALLVMERGRAGLVFDPARDADDLLEEAARAARVAEHATAGVFSLEANTSEVRLVLSTAPRPLAGPAVRPPAVAGQFYPHEPAALARMVEELLGEPRTEERWPAAMVPHAGLRFSGHIAAGVLRRLAIPQTIIIIGPKHTPHGVEWAVAPHREWALPGSTLAADPDLARELVSAIPGLELDSAAHQQEHGIEVELPFLARLAPQTRVVGIAIGQADLTGCQRFAEGLAEVLERRPDRPLLLISSDMNHFATDEENRRLDELALEALETLEPEQLYRVVKRNHISMCGVLPAVIVLETLRRLGGLSRAERAGYATSADVTGDRSRVVGYAGMLLG
ncbi:MAG: AmmeMemoRadiSam system protein B [Gemmataceae bacterium]|nr:AmmeMemoRadiSam system protein B [Gemmataceae bacterium]